MKSFRFVLAVFAVVGGTVLPPGGVASAIVGGQIDQEAFSPYVKLPSCSGTVIAPTWVLTARHCVDSVCWDYWKGFGCDADKLAAYKVQVQGDRGFVEYGVARITFDRSYAPLAVESHEYVDIALVQTRSVIEGVTPVRYGTLTAQQAATWRFKAVGYGFSETKPDDFRIPVRKTLDYPDAPTRDNVDKNSWTLWTFHGTICGGDSGGALLAVDPATGEQLLVGVVVSGSRIKPSGGNGLKNHTWGECEAGTQNFFEDIAEIYDWIELYTATPGKHHLGDARYDVRQDNIQQTICNKQWVKQRSIPQNKINENPYFKDPIKYWDTKLVLRIPLALGGTLENTSRVPTLTKKNSDWDWGGPRKGEKSAKRRTALETAVHTRVCNNTMTLSDARAIFAGEWWEHHDRYVRPTPKTKP